MVKPDMSMNEAVAPAQPWIRIPVVLVAGFFALLFVYNVWESLSSLLAMQQVFDLEGLTLPPSLWLILLAALILPIVAWAAALLLSRRRKAWEAALVFLAALAANEALFIGLSTLVGMATVPSPAL